MRIVINNRAGGSGMLRDRCGGLRLVRTCRFFLSSSGVNSSGVRALLISETNLFLDTIYPPCYAGLFGAPLQKYFWTRMNTNNKIFPCARIWKPAESSKLRI